MKPPPIMPLARTTVHSPDQGATPAEWAAAAMIAVACIAAPLAFGATGTWQRLGVEAAMGAATVLWALSGKRHTTAVLAPLLIAASLGLQLLPLPDGLLGTVSPVAAAAWKIAHMGLSNDWGRVSVDPSATAAAIQRLLLAAATVSVVGDLSRHLAIRKMLGAALCVVCVTIWLLGVALPFDRKNVVMLGGLIDCKGPIKAEFWKTPIEPPIATNGSGNLETITVGDRRYKTPTWIAADAFGPYIYSNHFAGAMCLTLPVTLGAIIAACRARLPALFAPALVIPIAAAAMWTVGISATSRAGVVSLGFSLLVFAALSARNHWLRRGAMVLAAAYAVGVLTVAVVLYGGIDGVGKLFPDAWEPRVAAMLGDGRAVASRVALRMFAAAPLLGSGLGTYGELFPRFTRGDSLLHYAHNDYVQWLAETGLTGFGLACAFAGVLGTRFVRWRRSVANTNSFDPLGAGVWSALAGIAVHTGFDWNLHIAANALLACVVTGMAIALGSAPKTNGSEVRSRTPGLGGRLSGIALATGALISVAALACDAATAAAQRQLREAIVASRLETLEPGKPNAAPQLLAAIEAGEQIATSDPTNGSLAVLIGLAYLHLAIEPAPYGDRSSHTATAERWFEQAQRNCATCMGLPEPPPDSPAQKRAGT